jgi:hypothetical protein
MSSAIIAMRAMRHTMTPLAGGEYPRTRAFRGTFAAEPDAPLVEDARAALARLGG